ncbi:MAG: imelysin family protein [Chloroflexaceae bacterium]|nr:imelysin family protein [Chloroflexaceae bacterium]NJO07910.1 imelysin family protein [Chloroflexaceae bacterium]
MKHVLWLCSVALLVAGCGQPLTASPPPTVPAPQPVAEGFSRSAMLDDIANLVILPAYEQFTERTATLQEAARTLSDAPTAANLQATRQAWREAVLAWQPLRLFILDDIRRTLLHSGVNKWPTNTEFIEQFIAEEATLDAALIAGAGSTSKGVPALEYLLFSPTGDDAAVLAALTNDPRRMQYVVALTQDLHTTALALQEAWTQPDEGYVIEFVSNDSGGAMMQSSVSELSNELVNALEMLVQTRLGEPLGRANGGEPQPALVEAPYSDASVPAMLSLLHGFRATFTGGTGQGFDDYLDNLGVQAEAGPLSVRIVEQIDRTIAALEAIEQPLQVAVVEQPEQVTAAYDEARALLVLVKVDMAGALGVTLTFGDTDGD